MSKRTPTSVPPPRPWKTFAGRYPEATSAYDALSDACRRAGPLDDRAIALVKLAVSIGAHNSRTVHAHAKKALRAGVAPDALTHVAIAALPTIGLPRAMDALDWITETIAELAVRTARRSPRTRTPARVRRRAR